MYALFVEGGAIGMAILTIILLALLLAAWKAPAWVKETGIIALVGGVLWALMGFRRMAVLLEKNEIPATVVWGGIKVIVISLFYGLIIYFVSLIIRIIQKPRI